MNTLTDYSDATIREEAALSDLERKFAQFRELYLTNRISPSLYHDRVTILKDIEATTSGERLDETLAFIALLGETIDRVAS